VTVLIVLSAGYDGNVYKKAKRIDDYSGVTDNEHDVCQKSMDSGTDRIPCDGYGASGVWLGCWSAVCIPIDKRGAVPQHSMIEQIIRTTEKPGNKREGS
jgi:hypothetical protein